MFAVGWQAPQRSAGARCVEMLALNWKKNSNFIYEFWNVNEFLKKLKHGRTGRKFPGSGRDAVTRDICDSNAT